MTKLPEKYNDSCVKMFEFLKLLTEDKADYESVINLFSNNSNDIKSNPNVTLNKYLNALKIFGIKIKKYKNKYHLLNSPYTLDLSSKDIEIIKFLTDFMEVFPEGKSKNNFFSLLKNIEIRYSEATRNLIQKTDVNADFNFKFYFEEYKEIIENCEKFCIDKFKLEIKYRNTKNHEVTIQAVPRELKYFKRKICFSVFNQSISQICDIPVTDIVEIKQLPIVTGDTFVSTTVVFKLKSRLAKTYKLKEGETSQGYDENKHLIIINKNEDHETLLKRLMRYGIECEIISPKPFKEKMKELIINTLSNYENPM